MLSLRLGVADSHAKLHRRREVVEDAAPVASSLAPPRWRWSTTMKSKKSGGYSPKEGVGSPPASVPLMNVWKMVKKRLPFLGALPFLLMSAGEMRTMASSGKRS